MTSRCNMYNTDGSHSQYTYRSFVVPLITIDNHIPDYLASWPDVQGHRHQASWAGPHHQSRRGSGPVSWGLSLQLLLMLSTSLMWVSYWKIRMPHFISILFMLNGFLIFIVYWHNYNIMLQVPPEKILCRWVNYHLDRAKSRRRMENFSTDIKVGRIMSCAVILLNSMSGLRDLCGAAEPNSAW